MACSMSRNVHINPNFRGRAIDTSGSGIRPGGIHFNPHWKPKTEAVDVTTKHDVLSSGTADFNNIIPPGPSQKRTIHINPKVLARMMPGSIPKFIQQQTSCGADTSPITACKSKVEALPPACCKPKEDNAMQGNLFKLNTSDNFKTIKMFKNPAQLSRYRKVVVNCVSSPAIKTAKVVLSKYKYLNTSVAPSATILQSAQKTFSNQKLLSRTALPLTHSQFKYVRKCDMSLTEVQSSKQHSSNHVVSKYKIVKKIVHKGNQITPHAPSTFTPKRAKFLKSPKNVCNMSVHAVKSRYKLSKGVATTSKSTSTFKQTSAATNTTKNKSSSRFKYVRQTSTVPRAQLKRKSPKAVKSRFKIVRNTVTPQSRRSSRYRINRKDPESSFKQKFHPRLANLSSHRNKWINAKMDLKATKVVVTGRKLLRIGRSPNVASKIDTRKKAKLLKIGGVFYRSTRTSLTRSAGVNSSTNKGAMEPYAGKGQVLSIRGSKFVLDRSGKTLQRISLNDNSTLLISRRIHIGGVTFVRHSENTLVRSRVHEARNILSQAKQKSIAVLTSKLRKNNQPCLIYQRLGKCRRHEKGTCPRVHDRKHVAICNDFVNGKCLKSAAECLFSHDVGPEKMPTCHFFLQGCCIRDPCPYSHVKLNRKAAVCRDFLSGYCSAGVECKKRHVFLCPEFEETKRCSKGKYCAYRHADSKRSRTRSKIPATKDTDRSSLEAPEKPITSSEDTDSVDQHTRYYEKGNETILDQQKDYSCDLSLDENIDCQETETLDVLLPTRAKLGDLPAFIPF